MRFKLQLDAVGKIVINQKFEIKKHVNDESSAQDSKRFIAELNTYANKSDSEDANAEIRTTVGKGKRRTIKVERFSSPESSSPKRRKVKIEK